MSKFDISSNVLDTSTSRNKVKQTKLSDPFLNKLFRPKICINAAARCLAILRDQRREQECLLRSDSRRTDLSQRPLLLL